MTKKLATLVAMLACCVFGALAQRVATTPVTDVQTGVYMLRMKSDRIPGTDGAWVYYKDSHAWGESDNTALKVVTENPLSEDHYNYLWRVVRKDDGKITIQSFTANTYWAKAKGGKPLIGNDDNKWVPNDFPMSETENAFTLEQNGHSGYKLKTYSTRTYYSGLSQKSEEKEVYVVDNVNLSNSDKANAAHNIGYQQTSTTRSDITFEFYEVTQFPEKVSFTYNYLYDGVSKKTEKFDTYTYKPYPAVTVPDFIKANAPEGEIKPEDNGATINIECTPDLPFTLSTDANRVYYYLAAGAGTEGRTMLYANGKDLKLRAEAQADNLTAMRNDLWYVTGNPYDGLQFHNVGSGTTAMSYLALSDKTELWLTNSLGGGLDKWKVYRISDKAFGLYNYNNWLTGSGNVAWKLNGSKVSFEKIDANAPNTSDAFAFQAFEATYVLPLHNSEADNAAFATTCAPFNFAIMGDDVKAYAGKLSADGKELDMKEIEGNVPANQGVILKAAMGVSEVTVKVVNTADAIDNDLKGTNDEMTDLSQVYVFGRDNVTRHVGFFNAAGNAALPANRAYLDKPAQEAVNAVAMNFGNGMVTNINTAISAHGADNAPIYDLSGRRVQRTVKGSLYIKGGRKFMAQ